MGSNLLHTVCRLPVVIGSHATVSALEACLQSPAAQSSCAAGPYLLLPPSHFAECTVSLLTVALPYHPPLCSPQIDDVFLSTALYNRGDVVYRMSPADYNTHASWQDGDLKALMAPNSNFK
jgi:hypothetical protein